LAAGSSSVFSDKDPTLAELVKPLGYVTGQFGKNHLGDRNEFLPTVHGFDEFFGNLYHLNADAKRAERQNERTMNGLFSKPSKQVQ
jgi:arylsulfatase A-like enzyme